MKSKAVVSWASLSLLLASPAWGKPPSKAFDEGVAKYLASNCAEAMAPLYQASLEKSAEADRAHLYLAHCQSVLGQPADAAYNLEQIHAKTLEAADRKLYDELMQKHQPDIDAAHKLYYSVSPYAGMGTTSPDTIKGKSSFYGLSLSVARPTWSVGAFYESYATDLVPAALEDYTQSMFGLQLGYFVLPVWRISGSFTTISSTNDQLKSTRVIGAQTDYYFHPGWSAFLELYSSTYPTLVPDAAGKYKYEVSAMEVVGGLGFPIWHGDAKGLNGAASYTNISIKKPDEKAAVVDEKLDDSKSRVEGVLSAYLASASAGLTYWSGSEILGVRARGSAVYNSTDEHKSGVKLSLGYTVNTHLGLTGSYGVETYEATDLAGKSKDFDCSTAVIAATVSW